MTFNLEKLYNNTNSKDVDIPLEFLDDKITKEGNFHI